MRILFMPFSAPSHYLPMVPLIWAFRAAGHQVRVVGQPMIASTVISSGIPIVTIAESYDVLAEGRRLRELPREPDSDPTAGFRAMTEVHTEFARMVVADTASVCGDWRPDLVVGDPLMLAAPIVAAHAQAPLVKHLWGADTMRAFGCPGSGGPIDAWPDSLRNLYAEYEAEPQPETGVASIDPCPPSLRICETPSRIPIRYIPYSGANVIPPDLMNPSKKRRVLVTKGTMPVREEGIGSFPLAGVVNDLADLDLEVVLAVTSRDRESTRDLPTAVRVIEQVPIDTILPTCDAVVHHGGSGTLLTAARHGVPQVAITATPDEMAACTPLAAIGAGIQIPILDAAPDRITSAIAEVLTNEEIRTAVDGLRSEMTASPVPSEVVTRLCQLTTR